MVNIATDLQFGLEAEDRVLSLLQNKVDINITPTPQFHSFDYFCSSTDTYYELKTRRNKHDTYPDTMVGVCKLNMYFYLILQMVYITIIGKKINYMI